MKYTTKEPDEPEDNPLDHSCLFLPVISEAGIEQMKALGSSKDTVEVTPKKLQLTECTDVSAELESSTDVVAQVMRLHEDKLKDYNPASRAILKSFLQNKINKFIKTPMEFAREKLDHLKDDVVGGGPSKVNAQLADTEEATIAVQSHTQVSRHHSDVVHQNLGISEEEEEEEEKTKNKSGYIKIEASNFNNLAAVVGAERRATVQKTINYTANKVICHDEEYDLASNNAPVDGAWKKAANILFWRPKVKVGKQLPTTAVPNEEFGFGDKREDWLPGPVDSPGYNASSASFQPLQEVVKPDLNFAASAIHDAMW